MNELRWLLRAKRWAQHPPSPKKVAVILGVLAVCLLLAGIDHFWGWPEWLTVNGTGRGRILR